MRRGRSALIVSAVGAVLPALGFAQTSIWTFNGGNSAWTNSWQINGNWNPNGFPNSSNATVNFPAAPIAGGSGTVLIGAGSGVTINAINFVGTGTNTSGYTVGGPGALNFTNGSTINVSAAAGPNLGVATLNGFLSAQSSSLINKSGSGVLVLSGTNNFSGTTALFINAGVVRVINSNSLSGFLIVSTSNTGQLELKNASSGGTMIFGLGSAPVDGNGALFSSAGNNSWNGNWFVTQTGQSVSVAGGTTLTLNGNIIDGSDPNSNGFAKSGTGTLSASTSLLGILHINAGTMLFPQSSSNTMADLDIAGGAAPTARVDVTNSHAVVRGNVSPKIKTYLQSGYNGGDWTGNGVSSSLAQADAASHSGTTNLAVGYARGDQLSTYNGSTATFGAIILNPSDTAILLTTNGDTDLDGAVNLGQDFPNFVNGYTAPHSFLSNTDWFNGDFNFDGVIDLSKDFKAFAFGYAALDGSLTGLDDAIDRTSLSAGDKQTMHGIVASVPEPGMAILLSVLTGCVLKRQRRR